MEELLRVDGISKSFKLSKKQRLNEKTNEAVRKAVVNLSFSAFKGEIFGILGPNGAGKTTALRIISTLIKPDSGEVYLNNVALTKNPEYIRGRVGFLTSELKLEEFFTPNYLFDFFARLHALDEETIKSRKENLFSKFGINEFKDVKIANLSTGMKQKASLVISVLHNPDIIIFDEPTNGLDVIVAKVVTDFLQELKNEGKCVILSTHIFSLAEKLCDRVGVIIDGKLVSIGTLSEICGDKNLEERFFELYSDIKGDRL